MKIMMVITGMQSGGAERVMATLCNELSKRHKIRLVIMKSAESDYELSDRIEVLSGDIVNQSLIKSVQFTKKNIEEWKPDVMLSFMTKSNIIALIAKTLASKKCQLVIAERANPYNAARSLKIVRRFLYPKADGCVFQTEQAQAYYNNILKCKSIILRNPLNPDFNVTAYRGIKKKKIVTMGRLSEEKNQELLIKAFQKIAHRYTDYTVEIYGDGPLRGKLEKTIKDLSMENRVLLMGRRDNIQEYIKDAEIFVLPSNSEGMPNALLEAMAMGLACIATDCPIGGSAVAIQNNDNGILIPMNDVDVLAEKLSLLLDNKSYARQLGDQAIQVTQDFGTEHVCAQWENYLLSVVEGRV